MINHNWNVRCEAEPRAFDKIPLHHQVILKRVENVHTIIGQENIKWARVSTLSTNRRIDSNLRYRNMISEKRVMKLNSGYQ